MEAMEAILLDSVNHFFGQGHKCMIHLIYRVIAQSSVEVMSTKMYH